MQKKNELSDPASCLNSADADEPLFILRGNDFLAPMAIRHWITMSRDGHPEEKITEALDIAIAMEEWRARRPVPVVASCRKGN